MAFVIRSERDIKLSSNETNEVGPGQYDHLNPDHNSIQQAQVPFNSKVPKSSLFDKADSNLGPGSYEIDNKKNKIFGCRGDQLSSSNKLLSQGGPLKKVPFETKERRFKLDFGNNNPGPGSYNLDCHHQILVNKSASTNADSNNSNAHVGSPYRIVSIPSKLNPYGYQMSANGFMKMAKEGDTLSIFATSNTHSMNQPLPLNKIKYEKPYHFEALKSENKLEPKETLGNSINITTSNNTGNNTLENTRNYQEDTSPKSRKCPLLDRSKLKKRNFTNFLNEDAFESFCSHNPGPGYYTEVTEGNRNHSNNRYQSFGSIVKRDCCFSNKNTDLGPGEYDIGNSFNSKGYSERKRYYQPIKKTFENNSLKQLKIERQINKSKIGPGSYEPHPDQRSSQSKITSLLGSDRERFAIKLDDYPGPGSYECRQEFFSEEKNKQKPSVENELKYISYERSTSPAVGTYSPEIVNSIGYVNSKNSQKKGKKSPPFNILEKRHGFFKNPNPYLGPGSYNPYQFDKVFNYKMQPPFISNTKRSIDYSGSLGPALYDSSSYNDWIKKSFNVLFV